MKEVTKTTDLSINTSHMLMAVLLNLCAALAGFVGARASVQNAAAPFGLSVAAACPKSFTPAAVLGAAAGYFIPVNGFGGFKYIAALCAVAAIKYMLCSLGKIAENKIIMSLTTFAVCAITSVTVSSGEMYGILLGFCEGVLAAAGCFFFAETVGFLEDDSPSPDSLRLCSIIISVNILLMGLFGLQLYEVSIGRMLATCFCLAAARYGQARTGAICSISVALSVTLNNLDFSSGALAFCVAGLISGIFSKFGKIACSVSYLLTFVLSGILFKGGELSLVLLIEVVFGTAVYLLLPKAVSVKLGSLLSASTVKTAPSGLCDALTLRLEFASKALCDVSSTVDTVSRELSKINCPDFDDIVLKVENEVCKGCNLKSQCWDTYKDQTLGYISQMVGAMHLENTDVLSPDEFKAKCLRREKFEQIFKTHYQKFLTQLDAESRLEQVRGVVADQFEGISEMLSDLANEFKNDEKFDTVLADKVVAALKDIGIIASNCGCRIDKYGRITIEIRVADKRDTVFNRMHILRQIESVCDRDFECPSVTDTKTEVLITLSEKAVYTVDTAVRQINSNDNSICGDAYSCFYDGKGRYITLLSDGMGSGGRAAVDGAMATNILTRLLKSGFGWDCSLKILNSSMLFKSTDESLATVDAVCIDLFTGRTELFKAGAAPTLVRRSGRTGKAQSTSLPAGILRNVGFDKATIKLHAKDITVMMSDGAVSDGTDWICAILESWTDGSAKELCEKIASDAKRRRTDGHMDDITVIATILNKAV